MIIDLNKCIGCQTCTVACKTQWTNRNGREYMYWNNVETRPGVGYPSNWEYAGGGFDTSGALRPGLVPSRRKAYGVPWDYNHEEIMQGAMLEAGSTPINGPNWDEDIGGGEFPNNNLFYLPRICNHCDNPACLAGCNNQAIFKREQDGIVLIDLDRCQGERQCVAACPYKKIYFNAKLSRSEKCIFCFPRIEKGLPPACAHQCVGRARWVGFLDDEEGQLHKLVNVHKVALPLHPESGTSPNVFYIPPMSGPPKYDDFGRPIEGSERIDIEQLEGLFGPRVGEVIEQLREERRKRASGEGSEVMEMLIAYSHSEMFRVEDARI